MQGCHVLIKINSPYFLCAFPLLLVFSCVFAHLCKITCISTRNTSSFCRQIVCETSQKWNEVIPTRSIGFVIAVEMILDSKFALEENHKPLIRRLNLTQNELRMSKRNFSQRHLAYQPQHLSFRGNLKSMENVSKKLLSLELL